MFGLDMFECQMPRPSLPYIHHSTSKTGNMEWMEEYGLEQRVAMVQLKTPPLKPPFLMEQAVVDCSGLRFCSALPQLHAVV